MSLYRHQSDVQTKATSWASEARHQGFFPSLHQGLQATLPGKGRTATVASDGAHLAEDPWPAMDRGIRKTLRRCSEDEHLLEVNSDER